ncbi:undecaprenyl-phosphate glucose phosphotransferase [Flavobacterium urocaniciphilum]|uniref:Putative colanic acid biosysnthesis UDP-glucose lipid carrier transferase n=1 Tax=Flavobacterium urocaniciphilum TaxID=1299341 RepID=A0A1H9BPA5_9FLAO|nr:undecaprenyl-phosphate glucose phosphotransferase [Flavobacterium urocaniciphilum]SEP90228.1 putative colanic acid biosysnthesis UDP-glucose lipid carrier transferase [Flavobacterium urocaniciphilum]
MKKKTGRYSGYIRPIQTILDLLIINLLVLVCMRSAMSNFGYHTIVSVFWLAISYYSGFYEVYRYTKEVQILGKLFKQFFFISMVTFAYVGYKYKYVTIDEVWYYIFLSFTSVALLKFSIFFLLRKYRLFYGGNLRTVVIIGNGKSVEELESFFNDNPDYGYNLLKIFELKPNKKSGLEEVFNFVLENKVDEMYGSLKTLSNNDVEDVINFADNNLKTIKLLPDNKSTLLRNLAVEYYGYIPIISLRTIPLEKEINKRFKRVFDIIFSLLIIVFLLSWLIPILAILIKFDSRGPIFFKQKRNGLNYEEFLCYKFRSMRLNPIADLEQVQKNDPRITRLGRFLRKSSIDELPQFFNVLLGDMSVVGPRPHMVSHTEMYAKSVDKFMVRHFIKPGITGLAQINGYRGEVESDKDIINRVRFDIFYLENWTILLDLKIIFKTVINALRGEEKAY